MPNWCDTTINISLRNYKSDKKRKEAEQQFNEFVKKFNDANKDKKDSEQKFLQLFYPIPETLHIAEGTTTDCGMAVVLAQKYNDFSKIDEIMQYEWVKKDKTIKTREDLIAYLLEPTELGEKTPMANVEEGELAIENIKEYGCRSWYDWCVKNWGTKWDLDISDVQVHGFNMTIYSMTAWSPCLEGVTEISKDYPLLHFQVDYAEPGMGFQGFAEIHDGICNDNCSEYDFTSECEHCCACEEECKDGCPYGVDDGNYPDECPCRKNEEK